MFNVDKKSNVCSSRDFFIASPLGPFNDYLNLIIIYLLLFFLFLLFLIASHLGPFNDYSGGKPGTKKFIFGFFFTWPLQKVREESSSSSRQMNRDKLD